jgi:hypothetical protein
MYLSHLCEPVRQWRRAAGDIGQSLHHSIELETSIGRESGHPQTDSMEINSLGRHRPVVAVPGKLVAPAVLARRIAVWIDSRTI